MQAHVTVIKKFYMGPKGLCTIPGKSLVIFSLKTDLNWLFSMFALFFEFEIHLRSTLRGLTPE